jgi:hypothetical protein
MQTERFKLQNAAKSMLNKKFEFQSVASTVHKRKVSTPKFSRYHVVPPISFNLPTSNAQQKNKKKKEHQQPECIKGVPTFLKFNSCATSGHQQPRTKSQYGRLNFQNVQPIPASGSNSNQHTEKELIYPLVVGHWKQVFGQHPHFSLSLSLSLHFSILIFLH